jgi:hypothetical protein
MFFDAGEVGFIQQVNLQQNLIDEITARRGNGL